MRPDRCFVVTSDKLATVLRRAESVVAGIERECDDLPPDQPTFLERLLRRARRS